MNSPRPSEGPDRPGPRVAPPRSPGPEGPVVVDVRLLGGRTAPPWCFARTASSSSCPGSTGTPPVPTRTAFAAPSAPKSATQTEVEDLVMWSAEGFVNAEGVAGRAPTARRVRRTGKRQQQLLQHEPGGHRCEHFNPRTVRLTCHLRADAPNSDIDLYDAASLVWRVVAGELHLYSSPTFRTGTPPEGIVGVTYTGVTLALHRHPRGRPTPWERSTPSSSRNWSRTPMEHPYRES